MLIHITDAQTPQESRAEISLYDKGANGSVADLLLEDQFAANPKVEKHYDQDGQSYFSMDRESFKVYANIAAKENEVWKLYHALEAKYGQDSQEIRNLSKELEFLTAHNSNMTFTANERAHVARETAFRLLSTAELKQLKFEPDEDTALWAATNGQFEKFLDFDIDRVPMSVAVGASLLDHSLDALQNAITRRPDLLTVRDDEGRNLLHWALLERNKEACALLIDNHIDVNAVSTEEYMPGTPLEINLKTIKDPEITKWLLRAGADISLGFSPSNIFDHLIKTGDTENLKTLLDFKPLDDLCQLAHVEKADVLYTAAESKNRNAVKIADLLLQHGAMQNDYDRHEFISLTAALENKQNPELSKLFVDHWLATGHSFLQEDISYRTLFERAAEDGTPEIAQYIIDKDSNVLTSEGAITRLIYHEKADPQFIKSVVAQEPEWAEIYRDKKVNDELGLGEHTSVLFSQDMGIDLKELALNAALDYYFTNTKSPEWPQNAYDILIDLGGREITTGYSNMRASDLADRYGMKIWGPYADLDLRDLFDEINEFAALRMTVYERVLQENQEQIQSQNLNNTEQQTLTHEELTERLYAAIDTGDPSRVEEFFHKEGIGYEFPCVGGDHEWDYETSEFFEDAVTHFFRRPEEQLNPDILISLANHGAELNYREDQNSILQYSWVMEHPEIVPQLFNAGATLYEGASPDIEEPLATAVLDGSDAYLDALLQYGDLENRAYPNEELLDLDEDRAPFGAAIVKNSPERFAKLAEAFDLKQEAREAVSAYFTNDADKAPYLEKLDELKNKDADLQVTAEDLREARKWGQIANFIETLGEIASQPKSTQREAVNAAVEKLSIDACNELQKAENMSQISATCGSVIANAVSSAISVKQVVDNTSFVAENEPAVETANLAKSAARSQHGGPIEI